MRTFLRIGVGAALVMSTACAHFRVAPTDLTSSTVEETRRVHAIAWGALEPRIDPPNCQGNGLSSVMVRVTMLDALATGVTLGFWTPVTVAWSCAKERGGVSR